MSGPADVPRVLVGQCSDRGRRPVNQDFHGVSAPSAAMRRAKGVVVALADGIGSSEVSQVAAEFAVMALLDDYYCTADAWSVKKSVGRVLAATNSWLHSRTRQGACGHDADRGYVCTLSALVFKSATAHLFHVGDARVWRLQGGELEALTEDHRVAVGDGRSFLGRALGFGDRVEIDYLALPVEPGEVFVLSTDGVHEHVDAAFMARVAGDAAAAGDLDRAARAIVDEALRRGSDDNLTVQIVVVEALPAPEAGELQRRLPGLPPPPAALAPRELLDGWRIVRELHAGSRSHVYLAVDVETGAPAVLKTLSTDLQADPAQLERFLMEEWVARRIDNPHVLRACPQPRRRSRLYVATEYIEGRTLAQWMHDHPRPPLETVRSLVEQLARGLQAFHRLEMVHQDLRPANVMIDAGGSATIIDFGATRVAGIEEAVLPADRIDAVPGTEQYAAPEYFLGEAGTARSDLYSLAVIAYQLLSGRLPYGTAVPAARTRAAQRRLRYDSVLADDRDIPAWIDEVLRKALHPDPLRRHDSLSEFVHDLRHPGAAFGRRARPPLIERQPLRFWKSLATLLVLVVLALLAERSGLR